MSTRRIDLPQTVEACHQLILELYETIDELRARIAELERELYGTKRERFIADPWEDEGEATETHHATPIVPTLPCDNDLSSCVTESTTDDTANAACGSAVTPRRDALSSSAADDGEATTDKPRRSSTGRRRRPSPAEVVL